MSHKVIFKKMKYNYEVLKRHWRDSHWRKQVLLSRVGKILFPKNDGVKVVEQEWDNLIILDACRYDAFKEVNTINGKLSCIKSRGTDTTEFLINNFGGKYRNIIYITANVYVDLLLRGRFYRIVSVWDDGWDDMLGTVHPSTMVEYTIKVLEEYPDRRLIIHFIQPHWPFIGETKILYSDAAKDLRDIAKGLYKIPRPDFWSLVEKGEINKEDAWKAYKDNLILVLRYVKKLLKHLHGKTVITADHGEAFGEKLYPLLPIKIWGHMPSVRIDALTNVPWLEVKNKSAKVKSEKKKIVKSVEKLRSLRRLRV